MKLKTFQAKTMAEALQQVKRQLGRDAVILHTRTLRTGGLLGFRRRPMVEITAARCAADLPRYAGTGKLSREGKNRKGLGGDTAVSTTPSGADSPAESATITTELQALKSMVNDLVRETRRSHSPNVPDELFEAYLALVENEVSEELAQQLVSRLRSELGDQGLADAAAVRRRLATYVESMLPASGPVRLASTPGPTVIALVGPTGVGKTTTVAKLAANFRLQEERRVGLITIDTYRIAAVEQLRTYAQIIDIPLEVVSSPRQLVEALRRLEACDVVLIDTAGRSQNDAIKINELKCFLDQAKAHEVHLVLSSTSGPKVLDKVVERFSCLGIDRVIFTKLDEAIGFGVILTSLHKAGARLSYVTTGQDVPDDIEVGQPSRMAELILRTPGTPRRRPPDGSQVTLRGTVRCVSCRRSHP